MPYVPAYNQAPRGFMQMVEPGAEVSALLSSKMEQSYGDGSGSMGYQTATALANNLHNNKENETMALYETAIVRTVNGIKDGVVSRVEELVHGPAAFVASSQSAAYNKAVADAVANKYITAEDEFTVLVRNFQ